MWCWSLFSFFYTFFLFVLSLFTSTYSSELPYAVGCHCDLSVCECTIAVQHNTLFVSVQCYGVPLLMETRLFVFFVFSVHFFSLLLLLLLHLRCHCKTVTLSWSVHVCFILFYFFNPGNWIHMLVHTVLSCSESLRIKKKKDIITKQRNKSRHYMSY